jgi:hypoxanthine phosphoribosyltransferase
MPQKINYAWNDFDDDIEILTNYIHASQWLPDYIVGVKRGGLVPAIKLSHIFNKPLIMMSCQLRDNKDNEVRLYEVEQLPKQKNILIVDDICDSGITLQKIFYQLSLEGFSNIKACSLIYNPAQDFHIDYYSREIDRSQDDRWIIFPWESDADR